MHRKRKIAAVLALAALLIWTVWGNTALTVTEIAVESPRLPEAFDGFRIAQISDLHNAEFGEDNEKLLEMLRGTAPDIIVLTGDLVDSNRTDLNIAVQFAAGAVQIAPTYFVTGNHEALLDDYPRLRDGLRAVGVTVLEDESVRLERGGEELLLVGLQDIGFAAQESSLSDATVSMIMALSYMTFGNDEYSVLLAHRPELYEHYISRADLVLSGHAHGGQFRLPFIGGLVAPGQGLLPEYDAGLFWEDGIDGQKGTNMIVSRGLGNSVIPLRFNNRPEIVVAELQKIHS